MQKALFIIVCIFICNFIYAQTGTFDKFNPLIGKWEGRGEGFGSSESVIISEFKLIMNSVYLEVKNHAEFKPTTNNPNGEIHDDWGIISYDKARKKFVFRQFHVEGFVNQYILNDSLSNQNIFVFESEIIENFVPGGTARFTIRVLNNSEIETIFDVGMPGREMACYGKNRMKKQ